MHIADTTISHVCLLHTIQTHNIVLLAMDTLNTMGPNEQNQDFAELREKNCLYIHVVVLHKKVAKVIAKLESDRL